MTLKKNDFISNLRIIFNKLDIIKKPIKGLIAYYTLKNNNYIVNFIHENNIKISLPEIPLTSVITNKNDILKKTYNFFLRPKAEPLFRKVIFDLYNQKYIDSRKSIIDIGCWIGDNCIVWAKYLKDDAVVFAIDPSTKNISFAKNIATKNNVTNIKWVNAVCADKPGIPLSFNGSLDHARFKITEKTSNSLISQTLDQISLDKINSIGLMHLDVEGFELKVLNGATKIIEKSKPTIVFEQLISKENTTVIFDFLRQYQYDIYMINEVLPGCELDCRNFIAFDSNKQLPKIENIKQNKERKDGIFYASIGSELIKV